MRERGLEIGLVVALIGEQACEIVAKVMSRLSYDVGTGGRSRPLMAALMQASGFGASMSHTRSSPTSKDSWVSVQAVTASSSASALRTASVRRSSPDFRP